MLPYSPLAGVKLFNEAKLGNPVEGERDSGLKLNAIPL